MKKILFIMTILSFGLSSCKEFLNVQPAGARFLQDLSAVKATLGSFQHNVQGNGKLGSTQAPWPWLSLFFSSNNAYISQVDVWSFTDFDMRATPLTVAEKTLIDRGVRGEDWTRFYEIIGFMNLIIDNGKTAKGDDNDRMRILGEAYVERAHAYFKLLQNYAPLDDPTIGVPLRTNTDAMLSNTDLSRQPQDLIYAQIFADLTEAENFVALVEPDEGFNIMFSADWIYRLMAQIYLWKASGSHDVVDWERAAEYAEKAIAQAGSMYGPGARALPFSFEKVTDEVFTPKAVSTNITTVTSINYPECLFYWTHSTASSGAYLSNRWTYSIDIWRTLYHDGDKRKTAWFLEADDQRLRSDQITESQLSAGRKLTARGSLAGVYAFRLAEQWMIWIEALAMSGKLSEAQTHLATWRTLRYDETAQLLMPSTPADIQHEIYLERKREFLGEGDILWMDMKRFRIADRREVQGFKAVLAADDWRYQRAIPDAELIGNPAIKQNPGWAELSYQ